MHFNFSVCFFCASGCEGVHAVLPLPVSGPGGGRDCSGLGGVLPVSAQQHAADGPGERRDVDAEQGEKQLMREEEVNGEKMRLFLLLISGGKIHMLQQHKNRLKR